MGRGRTGRFSLYRNGASSIVEPLRWVLAMGGDHTTSSSSEPARDPAVGSMREYWNERARLNAPWYVDTSLSYDDPDLERFFETGRKIVAEALETGPTPRRFGLAVEIGCGLGRITLALADRFERVIGLDISSEMLERAKQVAPHERVEFVLGDGASLAPIGDGAADLVLTFTVFQHIPSVKVIETYITEAGRVLRPGGVFVFQWNNTPGSVRWRARRMLLSLADRLGRGERYGRNAPEFLGSRVSRRRIDAALQAAGLRLERITGERTLYAWAWAVKP